MAEHFAAERIAGTDAPQRSRDCSRFACLLKELATDAIRFVPQQRVAAMVRQWLSKATSPEENVETLIDATALASFLALFAPAASGATAVDRLTRQRGTFTREQQAATAALRQSRFRVMRVESSEAARCFGVKDLASDEKLHVEDDHLPLDCIGAVLAGRTAPFDATTHVLIGPVIRLEASGLDAALACAHLGGKGLGSSQRYAEAIYRHAVRHGPLDALGQDEADTLPFGPADSALDALAFAWAERSGDVPPQNEEIRQARRLTSIDTLLEALVASVAARERRRGRLADAYARLAEIQIEVIQSRCMVGMSGPTLAAVGAAIAHAVVAERAAGRVRALFEELRERI
ncbi:MAG: hypothetical protein ACREFZ_05690, partial [Acetobacteraceae bacterium]